ncbi:MAG: NAD(P)/FAD-dependent oxidoreductase [Treponema sp.]|nr:NAD(P)/FAD-dependent oxidoreductase [Treponema sp.]
MGEKKKVVIIGAGISGLSAGVYAARSGFDTLILEQHTTFGGLSTGWSRKGYFFEGGMHWLTGSSEKLKLNTIWKETGALKENNPVENRDPYYTLIDGDKELHLWRDVEKLKSELMAFAPEDAKMIKRLCRDIKYFKNVHLPVNEVPGLKTKNHLKSGIGEFIKMAPAGLRYNALSKLSYVDYVNKFKNENIRHILMCVIGDRYNAISFIYAMAAFASGDCGYPDGGSIRMAQNMVDEYIHQGGKLEYHIQVKKVVVENGKTIGVQTKDKFIPADAVIVTQDARSAVEKLFDEKPKDKWIEKMKKRVITEQNIFFCLGIKANLSHLPYSCVFPLKEPWEVCGTVYNELRINNYAKYKDHSPEGCTSITCLLLGESYPYWKAAKADGTYKEKKMALGKEFIERLAEFIPELKGNVEALDVATPCTYERYCSSYEGSWMSVWNTKGKQYNYPQECSIKGVYFCGQRIMMPGGLPIAVYTGRRAVQLICKNWGEEFK